MNVDEKEMKTKFINYENNLDQLTLMYHQLTSSKNLLSKENQILEKKLKRKTESMKELEKSLSITREQVAKLMI